MACAGLMNKLDAGLDVNGADHDGNTLLHVAADSGSVSLVKVLLARGATPNVINTWNLTPAALATIKGHGKVVTEMNHSQLYSSMHASFYPVRRCSASPLHDLCHLAVAVSASHGAWPVASLQRACTPPVCASHIYTFSKTQARWVELVTHDW